MTNKAVVLLSGGLDSSTCLGLAKSQGYDCYALSINYEQRNESELIASQRVASFFAVKRHEIITLPTRHLSGSALIDKTIDVPEYIDHNDIPITYVPARNTTFLAIALGWAEALDAEKIVIGTSAVDYSGYPDCRPAYIEAFQNMANLATKKAVEGTPIIIDSPLIHLSKAETIKLGLSVGVDYSLTVTCYQANVDGEACGQCEACHYRQQGFVDAGVTDPTRYLRTALTE